MVDYVFNISLPCPAPDCKWFDLNFCAFSCNRPVQDETTEDDPELQRWIDEGGR
jgi:hypothetical protein